ncbi:MAG: hypothetical protein AAFX44_06660 [Pseudomonadota bacterium]
MAKFAAQGAELRIGAATDNGATLPGSDTFTKIGNVQGFSGPSGTKPEIDVTDLDSAGKEFLAGLPDFGSVTFTGWFNEADAAQDTLWSDFVGNSPLRNIQIVLPNTEATTLDVLGYVSELSVDTQTEQGVQLNGSIRLSGGLAKSSS